MAKPGLEPGTPRFSVVPRRARQGPGEAKSPAITPLAEAVVSVGGTGRAGGGTSLGTSDETPREGALRPQLGGRDDVPGPVSAAHAVVDRPPVSSVRRACEDV